jgi:CCR4-NOT transcription complex subunit 4
MNFAHRIIRIQSERKQKERQKKQTETHQRRALSDIRVIQRNLVYVTNIAVDLAKEEVRNFSLVLSPKIA